MAEDERTTTGTVKDAENFDAERDAETLRKAMKGMGTDENAITSVLACRSNSQRQQIKVKFAAMFGKELKKELKSELSGNYEAAVLELLMEPAEYDAYQCHSAISGLGTDESCLIEILCSRSNGEIHALREAYKKYHKKDLVKDIRDDTSGHLRRLLVSLVQGERPEDEVLDQEKARKDALALFVAGEAKLGTDESRFNVVLASRSIPQLLLTFDEYEKVSENKTIEKAISSEMSGDLKEGMLSVVKCARNKSAYFAERLYQSMKGLGTNDRTLIRIMVSRCEVDMVQIKQEFQRAYGKTLDSFIKDDCSGDYKRLLMQLCTGN